MVFTAGSTTPSPVFLMTSISPLFSTAAGPLERVVTSARSFARILMNDKSGVLRIIASAVLCFFSFLCNNVADRVALFL